MMHRQHKLVGYVLMFLLLGVASNRIATADGYFVRSWSYLTTQTVKYLGAVVDGKRVFVPLRPGRLVALKLATGEQLWETELGGEWLTCIVFDGTAVFAGVTATSPEPPSTKCVLFALNKLTGQKLWEQAFDDRITSLTFLQSSQREDQGHLLIGTTGGSVISMDPGEQKTLWKFQSSDAILGRACLDQGVVYVGNEAGILHALDAAGGSQVWSYSTRGPIRARAEVRGDRVFVASFDGSVYCLDRTTGAKRWSVRTGAAIEARPAATADSVIVGSYDNLTYAFDWDSGGLRWKVKLSGRIIADPIEIGRGVFMSALRASRGVVLDSKTGREIGSLELEDSFEIIAPPVGAADMIVVTTNQGIIAARAASP